MYKQHDSHLGFLPSEVGDLTGPPAHSLGGSAIMASSVPDRRSEGLGVPLPGHRQVRPALSLLLSPSQLLMVVYIRVGLTELRMGMLPNPVVRVTAGIA